MVSRDTVDTMIDEADDLEVWQVPSGQATKLASTSVQGAAREIAPEEDFKAAQYVSELGAKIFTWYYTIYQIPDGLILTAPGEAQAFGSPSNNVALYEQALMAGLRFSVPWFLRELLFCLGLAPKQLMPNAWRIAIGCMVLWELTFQGRNHLAVREFFRCYVVKEQEPGWFFFASRDPPITLVTGFLSSYSGWKTCYFFILGENWECPPSEVPEVKFNKRWVSVISPIGKWLFLSSPVVCTVFLCCL